MGHTLRVLEVEDRRSHKVPHWHVLMEREDGWRHAHVFPDTIFEIRAGEYDIDPDDIETLLDVVLHEPYIDDPVQPRYQAADPAAAEGHVVRAIAGRDEAKEGTMVPAWLYNATSIAQARMAHLARIEHAKVNRMQVVTAPGDALDIIRTSHKPSYSAIAIIRREVALNRRRAAGLAMAADPARRAERRRPKNPMDEFRGLR